MCSCGRISRRALLEEARREGYTLHDSTCVRFSRGETKPQSPSRFPWGCRWAASSGASGAGPSNLTGWGTRGTACSES